MKIYLRKIYPNHSFTIDDVIHQTLLLDFDESGSRSGDKLIKKVLGFILKKKAISNTTTFSFDVFAWTVMTIIMLLDERDTPLR